MIECEKCNNYIPDNEEFLEEYYVLNKKIKELIDKKDNFKLLFFKNLIKNFQHKTNTNLCFCIDNLELKKELLNKYLKEKEKLKEKFLKNIDNIFIINNDINLIETKLSLLELTNLLKKEEKFLFFKYSEDYKIVSYYELIDLIKNNEIDKDISLLIIYNLEQLFNEDKKEDFYYYDNKIIDLLKYRNIKGLTTYLIYQYTKPTNKLNKQINKINNNIVKDFYKYLIENKNIKELTKLKDNNKTIYYIK